MTKKQLKRWLENKMERTLAEHYAQSHASMQQLLDETYSALGLSEVAEQIQSHLIEAAKLWGNWKQQNLENADLDFCLCYSGLDRFLSHFTETAGAAYQNIITNDVYLKSAAVQSLKSGEQQQARNIKKTYYDVLAVLNSMNTTKEAEAYLTALGFDLTEQIESPESPTELASKINPNYLFIEKPA